MEQGPQRQTFAAIGLQRQVDRDPLDTRCLCLRRNLRDLARAKLAEQEVVEVHFIAIARPTLA